MWSKELIFKRARGWLIVVGGRRLVEDRFGARSWERLGLRAVWRRAHKCRWSWTVIVSVNGLDGDQENGNSEGYGSG